MSFPLIRCLLACLLCAGCAASSTYRPMEVAVRDRVSREPVGGASIEVRPVSFFVPSPPFKIFDPSPPRGGRSTTGADGVARLEVIYRHPVQIRVVAPGYQPAVLDLDDDPAAPLDRWIDPEHATPSLPDETRLEVRMRWIE